MERLVWQPVVNPANLERHDVGFAGYNAHADHLGPSPDTDPHYMFNAIYENTDINYFLSEAWNCGSGSPTQLLKFEPQGSPASSRADAVESTDAQTTSPNTTSKTTPEDFYRAAPEQVPISRLKSSSSSSVDPAEPKRSRRSYRLTKYRPLQDDVTEPHGELKMSVNWIDELKPSLQERNRLAASKCRRNKRRWEHDLEEDRARLELENSKLQEAHSELTEEVIRLKSSLMEHAACSDKTIDLWLSNEARRFVGADNSTPRATQASRL